MARQGGPEGPHYGSEETRPHEPPPVAESFWYTPGTSTATLPIPSSAVAPEKTERLRVPTAISPPAVDKGATAATARLPVVQADPTISNAPSRRDYRMVPVVAVLVVAAFGGGVYLHRQYSQPPAAPVETPAVAETTATEITAVDDRPVRKDRPKSTTAVTQDPEPATTVLPTSTPSLPKLTAPTAPSIAGGPAVAKSGVQNSTHEPPAVPARSAPLSAPRVADVAATAAAPATSEAPMAPFFETKDVNESPRIMTRVEPKVPKAFRDSASNEIVVVRALVSQGGRPSRISLLRRTKAGPELDSVVVDAVNQWTFAPAIKKGKAVSCWFNFGVQLRSVG